MTKLFILLISIFVFTSCTTAFQFSIAEVPISGSGPNKGNSNSEMSSTGGNFETQDSIPIIERSVNPNYKDFSIKNKSVFIEVMIPNRGRSLDDILIKEIVDKNLQDIHDLNIYVENPIFSTKRVVNKLNVKYLNKSNIGIIKTVFNSTKENYTIIDNAIYIKIPRLNLGENIFYNYTVKSNKSGIFNVDTFFRLNGSKWPDSLREDTIEVRPPEIEVDTKGDQFYAICEEPLNITYNILHKLGWSSEKIDISVYFNKSDKYTIFIRKNGDDYDLYDGSLINLKLIPLEITQYPIQVVYYNAGKHPIPYLNIVGATVNQEDVEVEVMPNEIIKFLQDYGAIMALIGIIITIIGLWQQQKQIQQIQIKIHQINQHALHIKMENGTNVANDELNSSAPTQSED